MLKNFIIICLFIGSSVIAQPKLEISPKEYNFGKIPQGSIVMHKFWFKSVGDDTLKISEIKTGCSCAIMPLKQDFILPGDSMEVEFVWDVGRRVFKIGRYPYIYTNASKEPYRMTLTGEVHTTFDSLIPVSIVPYKFELSKIRENSIDEIRFTLTNRSDIDIDITLLTPLVDECFIELPQSVAANGKAVGKIKVKDDFLDKEFKGSITFLLNNKDNTRITIPYRRKIY